MNWLPVATRPILALLALTVSCASPLQAANDTGPFKWKRPVPGAKAFLGDDGGGANTATVCETSFAYRNFLKGVHSPGCQDFQHDLPAVIEVVLLDRATDLIPGLGWIPLAKVHIPSRNFTGYLTLMTLHPIVPRGTIVYFNTGIITLYPTRTADEGMDLGQEVSAKVIKYDPTPENSWAMQVTILDGEHASKTGWMSSYGALEDGSVAEQFYGAIRE